jgi:hypothetical protein
MDKRHSGSSKLSSVNLQFNTLGRYSSPRASPARSGSARSGSARSGSARSGSARSGSARSGSARSGSARSGTPYIPNYPLAPPLPPPIPRILYRNSLVPSPLPILALAPAPAPIIPIKTSPVFSPKKPSKLSPEKPKTPAAKPVKPAKQNKIYPVIPTGQAAQAEQAQVVANKKLELPDKFLAIYYVDLIYETIKGLSSVILDLIKDFGKGTPLFKEDAVSKLEGLKRFIDKDRYMYLPSDINNTNKIDIKELYLLIKLLIKNPQDIDTFLKLVKDIHKSQGYNKDFIDKYESYIYSRSYTQKGLKNVLYRQYFGLTRNVIRFSSPININGVKDKLQSLEDAMAKFIDIINNILIDNDSEHSGLFSGGFVLFPNLRYNREDHEYTPLVNRYIDANANNFKKIYGYFQTIFNYFKKIIDRMVERYEKEYKNVVVKHPQHKEYNENADRYAIYKRAHTEIQRQEFLNNIESVMQHTNREISMAEKEMRKINNNVPITHFQKQLDNMSEIIEETQKETNNLYHKLG